MSRSAMSSVSISCPAAASRTTLPRLWPCRSSQSARGSVAMVPTPFPPWRKRKPRRSSCAMSTRRSGPLLDLLQHLALVSGGVQGAIRHRRCATPPARSARHGPASGGSAGGVRPTAQHRGRHRPARAGRDRCHLAPDGVRRPRRPSPTRVSSGASSPPGRRPATRTGSVTTTTISSAGPATGWSTSTVRSATPPA